MTALRELAERWRKEASNTFGFHAAKKCAAELLAALDAEGGGGAVGAVSASELQQLEYDIGQGKYTAPWVFTRMKQYIQAHPHPARSGVVRDEDVRDAARYRWLRENVQPFRNGNPSPHAIVKVSLGIGSDQRERSFDLIDKAAHVGAVTLDQAIDAARKGEST